MATSHGLARIFAKSDFEPEKCNYFFKNFINF